MKERLRVNTTTIQTERQGAACSGHFYTYGLAPSPGRGNVCAFLPAPAWGAVRVLAQGGDNE
jgi:hypothetical protein